MARALAVALLALTALIAGCTSPESPDGSAPGPTGTIGNATDARPDNGTVASAGRPFSVSETFSLSHTRAMAQVTVDVVDPNCLRLTTKGNPTVTTGSAVATWTAQSPLAQTLDLRLADFEGDGETLSLTGTSPLTLPLDGVALTEKGQWHLLVQVPGTPSAAIKQEISLHLTLEGAGGTVEPKLTPYSCGAYG